MQVIKRDGRVVNFNQERIVKAITMAMAQTTGGVDIDLANKIATAVERQLEDKNQASVYEIQDFEVPISEKNKTYTRVTHYMKFHPNYLKMSPNAMVVLDYMKEWAFNPKNTEYIKYGTFDFAPSLVSRELKIMSDKTARNALKELQHYGFIEKANNAGFQYGLTQKWRFSSEWQYGERPLYTKEHIKGSSRDG